ncbi:MAG: cation-translocating P-type ATPase [Candidatus Micrarchaeia archaeon]
MPEFYQVSVHEVMERLGTSEAGLSDKEAKQRLIKYGKNIIERKEKFLELKILINQFKSPLIFILIVAAVISFLLHEVLDAYAIVAILILNAALGFYQEYKAERAIALLKKLSLPKAVVVRSGRQVEIPSEELVPGDIMLLKEGDRISADIRIIESKEMLVDESILTGESLPVGKNNLAIHGTVSLADRKNMAYSGTSVVGGRCKGVVVATGMSTEFGRIAEMIEVADTETPLHRKLAELGRNLGLAAIAICALIAVVGILKSLPFIYMLLTAIALAVAVIPEGLPAVVTVCLALGTQRMLARNALVRKLHAIETLGSVTVICADKTGTITCNEMTVTEIWAGGRKIKVTGRGYETEGMFLEDGKEVDIQERKELSLLLDIAASCNNASLPSIGDPTEIALLVAAAKAGIEKRERTDEIPFSSERKWMATIHKIGSTERTYAKGAVEKILSKCDRIMLNGKTRKITDYDKKKILRENEKMSGNALRILAFAYSESKPKKGDVDNLIFIGMAGMIDPPRPEIKDAVSLCKKAGIRVIMITGDHKATALAVAKQIGLAGNAVEGMELNSLSEEQMKSIINKVDIFARVDPSHKVKILEALRAQGEVVAMTGDGINDAPALKMADVGIAMGIKGTDVSREASDIVLRDDNFASIVAAVREGRATYDNIRKFVKYLVAANIGEVEVILVAVIMGAPILLPLQILWINIVTDGLPALALGVEPAENVMKRKPRSQKEDIMYGMWRTILISGMILAIVSAFCLALYSDASKARTMLFNTVVFFELFLVFSIKSDQIAARTWGSNKWLLAAVALSAVLQLTVIHFVPQIFDTVPLSEAEWFAVLLMSATGLLALEIEKSVRSKAVKRTAYRSSEKD